MATGLSRKEHYALIGLVALLLGGWGLNIYRAHRAGTIYVEGQGRWEKVVEFEASPQGEAGRAGIPPVAGPAGEATITAPGAMGLDLNTATLEDLDQLPGIGAVRAQAILDARQQRGGFRSLDELLEVNGIGAATLERLRPYFRPIKTEEVLTSPTAKPSEPSRPIAMSQSSAISTPASPVNINTADTQGLKAIKGIGDALALRIVEDRQANGPFWKPEDLQRVKGIGPKSFEAMRPMICVQ